MTTIVTSQSPDNTWHVHVVVNPPLFVYEGKGLNLPSAYREAILQMGNDMQVMIPGHYAEFVAGTSYDDY